MPKAVQPLPDVEAQISRGLPGSPQVRTMIEALCKAIGKGGRIPGHLELMASLNASERAVRTALKDLQDEGKLVRRRGLGTFVAENHLSARERDRTIVAIARPDRSFFDRCVEVLFNYTEERGLGLLFRPTVESASPSSILALADNPEYDYLVFGINLAGLAEQLNERGRRVVLVGAPPAGRFIRVPCVFNDHRHGGYLIARHLINLGHRRIVSVVVDDHALLATRRWQGYQRAVSEAARSGIRVNWGILSTTSAELEGTMADLAKNLQRPEAPTALAAWNDHDAIRVMIAMMRAGIDVPHQMSLAGYDDLPSGLLSFPPLTTVHHGVEQQIDAAVELLFSEEPLDRRQAVIVPNLVVRSSTAVPRD